MLHTKRRRDKWRGGEEENKNKKWKSKSRKIKNRPDSSSVQALNNWPHKPAALFDHCYWSHSIPAMSQSSPLNIRKTINDSFIHLNFTTVLFLHHFWSRMWWLRREGFEGGCYMLLNGRRDGEKKKWDMKEEREAIRGNKVENKDVEMKQKSFYFLMLSHLIGLVYECFISCSLINVACWRAAWCFPWCTTAHDNLILVCSDLEKPTRSLGPLTFSVEVRLHTGETDVPTIASHNVWSTNTRPEPDHYSYQLI